MRLSSMGRALFVALIIFQSCSAPTEEDQLVTISTDLGDITLILFDDTPKHKASFLELAEDGAYDSTSFNRVIRDFMIQGGDISVHPAFEMEARRLIPAEIMPNHFHKRGMLGAARQTINRNPLRKSSTQFYIVQGKVFDRQALITDVTQLNNAFPKYLYDGSHEELIRECMDLQNSGKFDELQKLILDLRPEIEGALGKDFTNQEITEEQIEVYTTVGGAPHLDGDYTVFGQVLEGMDVVDKIAALKVDDKDKPIDTLFMKLHIKSMAKDSITMLYGFEYPTPEPEK